jgi:hypothetical protein
MENNMNDLCKRGWVSDASVSKNINISDALLLEYLNSGEATKRTIAAHVIKSRGDVSFVEPFIAALCKEKKLYSKIALSEALGSLGPASVIACIPYLGKIGKNQHVTLPVKPFLKNNYPLPRDIIARTICKAGELALPILIENIDLDDLQQLSEGIDAIGYISYYKNNDTSLDYILMLLDYHRSKDLIVWKTLRALQAFPNKQVTSILETVITTTNILQHQWEAQRSLKKCLEKR